MPSTLGLTQNELQSLDNFLRNEADTQNNFGLTHIHGFLCAILTAPTFSQPDQHAAILDKILTIKGLPTHDEHRLWLIELIDQMSSTLQENTFSPLLFRNNFIGDKEEAVWELLKEWSQGYLLGFQLDSAWMKDNHGHALTMTMGVLADEFDLTGQINSEDQPILNDMPHKVRAHENLHKTIASLYDHWKEQRLSNQKSNKNLY